MCRFICYLGPSMLPHELVFNTQNSLIYQSKYARKRQEPVNGDGFGFGWYPEHDDPNPGLFKSIEPAWSNRNLFFAASKIKTSCFFAHVRDASEELPVTQTNCHPFYFGKFLWMHNGWLKDFHLMKRSIIKKLSDRAYLSIEGNTDSEYAFALFLDKINFACDISVTQMEAALLEVIEDIRCIREKLQIDSEAQMNFAVTNGQSMVASRYTTPGNEQAASLFQFQGQITVENNQVQFNSVDSCENNTAVIIASEPLSNDKQHWRKVEPNHYLLAATAMDLQMKSFSEN